MEEVKIQWLVNFSWGYVVETQLEVVAWERFPSRTVLHLYWGRSGHAVLLQTRSVWVGRWIWCHHALGFTEGCSFVRALKERVLGFFNPSIHSPIRGGPECFIARNPRGLHGRGDFTQEEVAAGGRPWAPSPRGAPSQEAGEFSGRRWAVRGKSTNPRNPSPPPPLPTPPPLPPRDNATAFHILLGTLTPRAQTAAGPRGRGRCQRAQAAPQAARPCARPEPAPNTVAGGRELSRPFPGARDREWPELRRAGRRVWSGRTQADPAFPSASSLAAPALHHLQPAAAAVRLGTPRSTKPAQRSPAPILALSAPAPAPRPGVFRGRAPRTRGAQLGDLASYAWAIHWEPVSY